MKPSPDAESNIWPNLVFSDNSNFIAVSNIGDLTDHKSGGCHRGIFGEKFLLAKIYNGLLTEILKTSDSCISAITRYRILELM